MDYRDTVNLPKTNFSMKANLTTKEPQIREKWDRMKLYQQIRKLRKGKKKFILHDGPPYANGDLHIGTGMNKIIKDIVVRYKTMNDYDAPFIPGWDCHGMPIEMEVIKKLKGKNENLSIMEFRDCCEKYARQYIDIQREQFKSLGVMADWDNPYLTLTPEYEATEIEVFNELVKNGFVYRKLMSIPWCYHCKTALSEAELEYKEKKSYSIYVRFKLIANDKLSKLPVLNKLAKNNKENIYLVIWTTTPWTLPANLAVALHPDFAYSLVRIKETHSFLIILNDLLEKVVSETEMGEFEIVATFKGTDLEGLEYEHPLYNKTGITILADYVSKLEGTGCVHTAPGHGQEDYESGIKYKLPIFSPVDENGNFTEEAGFLVGKNVEDANEIICEYLTKKNLLLKKGFISHSYPHCWRCKNPVIFRATEQWFIDIDKDNTRNKLLDAISRVNWIPEWGRTRISNMVSSRPHWCISRQRTWGVPIPAIFCKECGLAFLDPLIISSVQKKFRESGSNAWWKEPVENFFKLPIPISDIHKVGEYLLPGYFNPNIEEIEVKCGECGSEEFVKGEDILDVWFDSAVSWKVVLYNNNDLSYPCDLYLEGTDQHRGWFQSSLIPSVLTQGKAPYKSVLTHGFVVTPEGEKISKSKKQIFTTVPEYVNKYGADVIRTWFASVDFTDDVLLSTEIIDKKAEMYRKIRNTFRFLLANTSDLVGLSEDEFNKLHNNLWLVDKVFLSKLQNLIVDVTKECEKYMFYRAFNLLYNFFVVDLSSLYFDILKDRLYTYSKNSLERRAAQFVLLNILVSSVKMFAPIIPHTTEEVWENLLELKLNIPSLDIVLDSQVYPSIHLTLWPKAINSFIDNKIEEDWKNILKLREISYREIEKLRLNKEIGSSLEAELQIKIKDKCLSDVAERFKKELDKIFIVSKVHLNLYCDTIEDIVEVSAYKTNLPKCKRCWIHSETVGMNSQHPEICDKCVRELAACAKEFILRTN